MSDIIRPIVHNLGFDEFGQLLVQWEQDGSTYSTICPDLRGRTCPICGHGWELSAEAFRNHFRSETVQEYCHKTCMAGYISMREAEMFYEALCDARGAAKIAWSWQKIPNEYRGAWNTPWFMVRFEGYVPKVKLGCRKRVYHMSMHDLRPEQVAMFDPMVEAENTTKGTGPAEVYIHAHSEAKVLEYLRHFYSILQADPPLEDTKGAIITRIPLKEKAA